MKYVFAGDFDEGKGDIDIDKRLITRRAGWRRVYFSVCLAALVLPSVIAVAGQSKFEKRHIDKIEIDFGAAGANPGLAEQYRTIAAEAMGNMYSTTRVRDSLEALYATKNVDTITVAASVNAADGVDVTYNIKRKVQAEKVAVIIGESEGDTVHREDILFKLNIVTPGTAITDQTLLDNSDEILDYLRDRGFYKSEVAYDRKPLANENEVGVTFNVNPNAQATVQELKVNIEGLEATVDPAASLKLKPGEYYSRDRLLADVVRIRDLLKKQSFLAPELDDPRVTYDSDANTVSIAMNGKVGPKVSVTIETEKDKPKKATQTDIFPVLRDGTLDFSAIVEGERRLENNYQEQGYFFVDVTPICSVKPSISDPENNPIANDTNFLCSLLGGEELIGREVEVRYHVELGRKLKLTEIRITGTNKLTYTDVSSVLGSQQASLLGVIPLLGYGHGYTSAAILEDDRNTIKSLMSELGYRDAEVRVNQGVSPTGDALIITFAVEEGIPTVVEGVNITGNRMVPTADLEAQLPVLTGRNYSRARVRNAVQKLGEYYSNLGYYDAHVTFRLTQLPIAPGADKRGVTLEFRVENEGKKVVINEVFVTGNEHTKTGAVLRAVTLEKGGLLKATDIYTSEQNLYTSDAFSRVNIKPQPAGETSTGERLTNVFVNVEEQPSRIMSYGGGYSTDIGVNGFFDIRHVNLLGNLWQAGMRTKVSPKQQLVQLDFIHPRFMRDGKNRFAPLTITAQYQRDSTITRFFRSAFDSGTFGIVQRVDADGNPIDEFGRDTGVPTINRLALSAETSRTFSRKSRSILFLRYRFEDVRLFNIGSLLIKDLLEPDSRVRISGFGATFARDTRRNCSIKQTLLDLIAKGEPDEPCRYNVTDPTGGSFLTADFNVSLPQLGANIGFQKFQVNYNYYYTLGALRKTTLAARVIFGFGTVFSGADRFTGSSFPSLNGSLPVSERFFAGGANSLRGFPYEEAGPRVVIVPTGEFRNSDGDPVTLDPFTVPFGGNAIASVNLEARIGISKSFRLVPFYDGGNVFRTVSDIFKPPTVPANDVALQNQRAVWTHTVGLGLRFRIPIGGEFGIDYGRMMNPPRFLIPQATGPNAIYQLRQDQLHFRFSQSF